MPRPIRLPKPKAVTKKRDPLDAAGKRLQDGADATTLLKQLDADPYACLGLSPKRRTTPPSRKRIKSERSVFTQIKIPGTPRNCSRRSAGPSSASRHAEKRRAFAAVARAVASSSGPTAAAAAAGAPGQGREARLAEGRRRDARDEYQERPPERRDFRDQREDRQRRLDGG